MPGPAKADGSTRRCDPKLAAFAVAGSLNWIGHWYRRDGGLSPSAIADEFTVRLTEGLAAVGSRQLITKQTPSAPGRRHPGRKRAASKTSGSKKKRTGGGSR
ncbi:hypothetical protein [Bradyrhizobium diazoefficiens]|uniref:hypothetical protein n=1 Tax=Bradyrhizobium TaxID=374 RepID=UPI0024C00521|nr:hypothetical protein [Bradyrhizobium diazoefficiens]